MNLSGIYSKLNKKEMDHILKLWNNEYKANVMVPLLPFLDIGMVYRLLHRNHSDIKKGATVAWTFQPEELVYMERNLLRKLRTYMSKERAGKMGDDYVRVECKYEASTDKAVLIVQGETHLWVPRSLLGYVTDKEISSWQRGQDVEIMVMEWFAAKNELEY